MAVTILISADDQETRAALLENGKLMDYEVEREERTVGNVYKGRVTNVLAGMDAAFVDIGLHRTAFIYVTDVTHESEDDSGIGEDEETTYETIDEALQVGQEILVQVVRPGVGTKGPRVSTRISLPGRCTVLLVHSNKQIGVSRRISDDHERKRLQRVAERVRPLDFGLIVRTEAEGKTERELQQDVESLVSTWLSIEERARGTPLPVLIHRDVGLVGRVARDWLTSEVSQLILDSQAQYEQVMEMLRQSSRDILSRVSLDTDTPPLFERHGIENEIERALDPVVQLRRGGYISIYETEALTAIDVNTGRYVGRTRLSETILRTNLEAAQEIARQLRLRDIGGIIVIDFIDMDRARDRVHVMNALEEALRRDRTRTRIVNISPLGLVEMTRRRAGRTLSQVLHRTCTYCKGTGRVKSAATVAVETRRNIRRMALANPECHFVVTLHPECAAVFVGTEGDDVKSLEKEISRQVSVRVFPPGAHNESVKIDLRPPDHPAEPAEVQPGQVIQLPASVETYPDSAGLFSAKDNLLIQLSEDLNRDHESIALRVTTVNRWYAEAEVIPPTSAPDH